MSDALDELGTVAAAVLRRIRPMLWRLRPATVVRVDELTRETFVLVDGETDAVPVVSLIGPVTPFARVMLAYVPPGGSYVIGWIGDPASAGELVAVDSDTANSDTAGTAAIAVLTVDVTLKARTAYRVTIGGGVSSSAAGVLADFRLRRDSGAAVTEFYRWRTEGAAVMNADAVRYLRRDADTDLSVTLELTLQTNTGTAVHIAAGNRTRYMEIHRAGHAALFPHAIPLA